MSGLAPILITGPTASGKSALAMALARHVGGVIINADSMQVYRELNILTARPSAADEAAVPHCLYGHVPASEAYSAGRYVEDVKQALAEAKSNGLRPIITGGTGLYIKALLKGLSPIPAVDEAVRAHWRAEADRRGAAALHGLLAARDPEMASRLNPADTQRIVRALEVLESSGHSLIHWQSLPGEPVIAEAETRCIVMLPDRETLHARADQRFDAMMAAGALDEVRALAAQGLPDDLPAMRALGVAPLAAAVRGEVPLEVAVARAKAETRQYIKRQTTWLRSNKIAQEKEIEQYSECNLAHLIAFIHS